MNVKNEAGCWQFELSEGVVTQLRVGYGFCLLLEDGLLIVIEEPFNLSTVTGTVLVPPGEKVYEVDAALPLFNQRAERIEASASGELRITFESGATIDVGANDRYENWQIVAPDGRQWIGLPGGGVTSFPDASSDTAG